MVIFISTYLRWSPSKAEGDCHEKGNTPTI